MWGWADGWARGCWWRASRSEGEAGEVAGVIYSGLGQWRVADGRRIRWLDSCVPDARVWM